MSQWFRIFTDIHAGPDDGYQSLKYSGTILGLYETIGLMTIFCKMTIAVAIYPKSSNSRLTSIMVADPASIAPRSWTMLESASWVSGGCDVFGLGFSACSKPLVVGTSDVGDVLWWPFPNMAILNSNWNREPDGIDLSEIVRNTMLIHEKLVFVLANSSTFIKPCFSSMKCDPLDRRPCLAHEQVHQTPWTAISNWAFEQCEENCQGQSIFSRCCILGKYAFVYVCFTFCLTRTVTRRMSSALAVGEAGTFSSPPSTGQIVCRSHPFFFHMAMKQPFKMMSRQMVVSWVIGVAPT